MGIDGIRMVKKMTKETKQKVKKGIAWISGAAMIVSSFAFFVPFANVNAATTTVEVSGDTAAGENQPGWLFNRDITTSSPFEFNTDQASIGEGSLYVQPISSNASDKFIAENFLNTPIADVESISYDFMIGEGGDETDAEQFYMNVYANFGESDDDKFYDCRYDVVPTTGSTTDWTMVTFDPTLEYPVTQSGTSPFTCPAIPVDMDGLSDGSTIRAIAINVGDTSTSDEGLDGYLDNVVVDMGEDVTVYDFEPEGEPALNAEDFGVVDFDTGLGQLRGYTAGFGLTDATLEGAQSVVVELYGAGDQLLQTNTAIISQFNADITGTQFSSPFDVSGDFDYVADGYWTNDREPEFGQSVPAVKVVATVTLEDGTIVTAENTNLTGDPSTIFPEDEEPVVPVTKDECMNGGWMTLADSDGNAFKNQGDCVSFVASKGKNKGNLPLVN